MGPRETRLHKRLTLPPTPATQVALLDDDLEPEPEEEAEFEISQKSSSLSRRARGATRPRTKRPSEPLSRISTNWRA